MSERLLRTMPLQPVLLAFLALSVALAPGCGDSGGSGTPVDDASNGGGDDTGGFEPGGVDPDEPLTGYGSLDFVGDLATAMCDWMTGCCTTMEIQDVLSAFGSADEALLTYSMAERIWEDPALCGPIVRGVLIDDLRVLDAAIASGRAQLNQAAVPVCVARYGDGSCPVSAHGGLDGSHPCSPRMLSTGLVLDGSVCKADYECVPGSYCDAVAVFGICRPLGGLDDDCIHNADCGGGLCGSSERVCVTEDVNVAPWCDNDGQCPAGQMCAESIDRCIDALELGSVCVQDRQCATGYCALETSQTCEEKLVVGAPCTHDGSCLGDAWCDDSAPDFHRCLAATILSLDQPCDEGAGICDGHLVCHQGICVARSDMGGSCEHDGYCPATGYCDASVCVPRVAIGGSCTGDGQCVDIGWCDGGSCVSRIALGLPCELGDVCVAGAYCDIQFGVVGTCASLPDLGSDCPDGACGAGLVCVSFDGACANALALDASCERHAMCGSVGQCVEPSTSSTICQAAAVVGLGETCWDDDRVCAAGLVCNTTCQALGLVGSPCVDDAECTEGTSCIKSSCSPPSGAYGACNSDPDCSSSLYCDLGVSQCTPMKTVDQPCSASTECLASLYCDPAAGVCAWEKALNEACSPGAPCKEGLFCANNGLCTSRVAEGFPCEVGVFAMCWDGLTCVDGVCMAPPGPGLPCHPQLGCAEQAVCDDTLGLCVARVQAGGDCDVTSECATELFCGEIGPSCAPRIVEGGSCWQDAECQPAAACIFRGRCRAGVEVGGLCDTNDAPCVDGAICDDGICVAGVEDLDIGAPCADASQCASGACSEVCIGFCQGP